jgi:hypothetical protein
MDDKWFDKLREKFISLSFPKVTVHYHGCKQCSDWLCWFTTGAHNVAIGNGALLLVIIMQRLATTMSCRIFASLPA